MDVLTRTGTSVGPVGGESVEPSLSEYSDPVDSIGRDGRQCDGELLNRPTKTGRNFKAAGGGEPVEAALAEYCPRAVSVGRDGRGRDCERASKPGLSFILAGGEPFEATLAE